MAKYGQPEVDINFTNTSYQSLNFSDFTDYYTYDFFFTEIQLYISPSGKLDSNSVQLEIGDINENINLKWSSYSGGGALYFNYNLIILPSDMIYDGGAIIILQYIQGSDDYFSGSTAPQYFLTSQYTSSPWMIKLTRNKTVNTTIRLMGTQYGRKKIS